MQDRVPPQNIEAEQSVLGAMLIDNIRKKVRFRHYRRRKGIARLNARNKHYTLELKLLTISY